MRGGRWELRGDRRGLRGERWELRGEEWGLRGVGGTEQDEFLKTCTGRCPQVSRRRGEFREQPLEAEGLGTQKECRASGQVVSPTRTCCLVSEADRLLISVVVAQRMTILS